MADGGRTFKLTFTGDTTDLQRAVKTMGGSMTEMESSTSKLDGALGRMITTAGGFVLGSAITQAPGFLWDAAQGAAADEQATMRLEQALRNAGGSFDENIAKVNERIEAGQKLAFTDDDVRDSFQTLLAATGSTDEALKRQAAAMDLARGANIDLGAASKMLGKLNEENVEVFKRLGITLGEGATEADALAAVQAKFGAQASAYAASTAGQFEVAKIQMAEAQETLGGALLPAMTALAAVVAVALPAAIAVLTPAIEGVGTAVQFVVDHWQIFLPIVAALGAAVLTVAVPALVALAAGYAASAVAAAAAAVAFIAANLPLIAIGVAVGLVVAAIVLLVQHWDQVVAKFPVLGTIADGVKAKLEQFTGWVTGTLVPGAAAVFDAIREPIERAVTWVREHWDDIYDAIEPVLKLIVSTVQTYFENVRIIVETVLGIIQGIVDVFLGVFTGDWDRAWSGVQQIAESVWDGIKGVIQNTIGFITSDLVPLMLDAAKGLGGALADGVVEGFKGIAGGVASMTGNLIDAFKGAVNAALRWLHDNVRISIPGFDPPGPGSIPGFDWSFPLVQFAQGGVVTRPTLAMIGEGGEPEAVVPLSRAAALGFGGGGTVIHITVNGVGDADAFVRKVDRRLRQLGQPGLVTTGR